MKLYRATSLDDIAKQFRANAVKATEEMNRSVEKSVRNKYSGAVITWNAAAYMLENMEIMPDNRPKPLGEILGPTEIVGSTSK